MPSSVPAPRTPLRLPVTTFISRFLAAPPPASLLWVYGPNGTLATPKGKLKM